MYALIALSWTSGSCESTFAASAAPISRSSVCDVEHATATRSVASVERKALDWRSTARPFDEPPQTGRKLCATALTHQ